MEGKKNGPIRDHPAGSAGNDGDSNRGESGEASGFHAGEIVAQLAGDARP